MTNPDVTMVMPSGKFRGKTIEDLPTGYLRWVAENWGERIQRDRDLITAANCELEFREKHGG